MSQSQTGKGGPPPGHEKPVKPWTDPILWLATGFGFGYSPLAPGTLGALWGLPLAAAMVHVPSVGPIEAIWVQVFVIVVLCGLGVPLSTAAARRLGGAKDPQAVVYDEIASMPITFFLVPAAQMSMPLVIAVGFLLNRVFDITKPPPCRQLERLEGGLGIMADDWASGVYSCLALHGCLWLWRASG